ncbi:MAG: hypothetical protein WA191_18145 [Telluria sp.]|nr:hypothetical protein [Telluria sp.]
MKVNELEKNLRKLKIPLDAYTLLSKPRDETLCIQKRDNEWTVFYSERGLETERKIFLSEDDACEYFLQRIVSWFK